MKIDRVILAAFVAAGGLWIAAFTLGLTGLSPGLTLPATIFVVLGSITLATTSGRTGPKLVALWAIAVGIFVVLSLIIDSGLWLSLLAGIAYGTPLYAVWVGTGFLIYHLVKLQSRRKPEVRPRPRSSVR